jgi:hypothetical protein
MAGRAYSCRITNAVRIEGCAMSIEQRINRLEQAVGSEALAVDGPAVRAAILNLLTDPDVVESLRSAAILEDSDLRIRSLASP